MSRKPLSLAWHAVVACAVLGGLAAAVVAFRYPAVLPLRARAAQGPAPARAPTATAFRGTPAVGALLRIKQGKLIHFCTAAIVASPAEDLGITAAHCLQGKRLGLRSEVSFAPGYRGDRYPFGRWAVRAAFFDQHWLRHRDANDDIAFFLIGPPGLRIQRQTGAETLVTNVAMPRTVQVIGYPNTGRRPVRCLGTARALTAGPDRAVVFRCDGFAGGTSGSPFLMNVSRATGDGELIGAISGYQHGGNLPDISYSCRFLASIAALYRKATA